MKPKAEWEKEFDEGIGGEIETDILASHDEFCISEDNCNCLQRYDKLKSFIRSQRQKLLKELRGEVEGMNRKGVFVIKGMPNEDAFYEYDKALQDVIKLLERKYV